MSAHGSGHQDNDNTAVEGSKPVNTVQTDESVKIVAKASAEDSDSKAVEASAETDEAKSKNTDAEASKPVNEDFTEDDDVKKSQKKNTEEAIEVPARSDKSDSDAVEVPAASDKSESEAVKVPAGSGKSESESADTADNNVTKNGADPPADKNSQDKAGSSAGSDNATAKPDLENYELEGEGEEHRDRELTFAEYSARQKRIASSKEASKSKKGAQADTKKVPKPKTSKPGYRTTIFGAFVQSYRVQALVIFLILADGLAGFAESLVHPKDIGEMRILGFEVDISDVLARSLQMSLTVFLAELVIQFVAFDKNFLLHPGYLLDLLVVGFQCYFFANDAYHPGYRLMSWLRLWRLLQIPTQMLAVSKQRCSELEQQLENTLNGLNKAQARATSLQITLEKEVETNKYSEQMLRQYKEEVETLREALQLASLSWTNQFGTDVPNMAPRFKVQKSGEWEKSYAAEDDYYDATPDSQRGYY